MQEYFHGKSIAKTIKVHSQNVEDKPGNVKEKYMKHSEDGLLCTYCDSKLIMTQSHCLDCPAWSELRKGLDLSNITHMVEFFRKLLSERARLEDEGKRKASHDSFLVDDEGARNCGSP